MQSFTLKDNYLLRIRPKALREFGLERLKRVPFETGYTFWEQGDSLASVLFPLRGVISLQAVPSARKRVEVAQVGPEGFADASVFLRGSYAYTSAVAITAGEAVWMPADLFRRCLAQRSFQAAVERYVNFLVVMLQQISTCSRVHGIEDACAGRLLLILDRSETSAFQLTQDAFSKQLGVRRASVNRGVAVLQRAGVIAYDRRGHLTVLNRAALEKTACSCYHAIESHFRSYVATLNGV